MNPALRQMRARRGILDRAPFAECSANQNEGWAWAKTGNARKQAKAKKQAAICIVGITPMACIQGDWDGGREQRQFGKSCRWSTVLSGVEVKLIVGRD